MQNINPDCNKEQQIFSYCVNKETLSMLKMLLKHFLQNFTFAKEKV